MPDPIHETPCDLMGLILKSLIASLREDLAAQPYSPERDRQMITTPELWPNEKLPLVRHHENGSVECGLMQRDLPFSVVCGNYWTEQTGLNTEGERWGKVYHYLSVHQIQQDGWRVD